MCLFGSNSPAPAPPPAAPPAADPVMTDSYSEESREKGAVKKKAAGTSQLQVNLDPTMAAVDKSTGLQISK